MKVYKLKDEPITKIREMPNIQEQKLHAKHQIIDDLLTNIIQAELVDSPSFVFFLTFDSDLVFGSSSEK